MNTNANNNKMLYYDVFQVLIKGREAIDCSYLHLVFFGAELHKLNP